MTLIAQAESAEDVALALSKFIAPVADHAPDITASISELYAIRSALLDVDTALKSNEYHRNFRLIDEDLELVCLSLQDTVDNIFRILGEIGNGSFVLYDGMYRQTWKEITLFFRLNGRTTLRMRLETYRRFILELASVVQRFAFRSFTTEFHAHKSEEGLPGRPSWVISEAISKH